MNISQLRYNILLHLKNIPAPRVDKKIVVIESDDYGGIRMPSLKVYEELKSRSYKGLNSKYNRFDTIETKEDLACLFDVLNSVKDQNGHVAVISPFVNVANPDFKKIKHANFQQYFYEPFTKTYEQYSDSQSIMNLWNEGIGNKIFIPQFHGKEHLSVQLWMQKLQEGNPALLKAFDLGFASVSGIPGVPSVAEEFRPEFYFDNDKQKCFLHQSIREGVGLFKDIFGYLPSVFVPSNSLFFHEFEKTVSETGIKYLNVAHKNPYPSENGKIQYEKFTHRQKISSNCGLSYYIRNCAFEPNDENYKDIDTTMSQVAAAFRLHRLAIISTHRGNFSGGLVPSNREHGLNELKLLLKAITRRWPEVEFMDSKSALERLVSLHNVI